MPTSGRAASYDPFRTVPFGLPGRLGHSCAHAYCPRRAGSQAWTLCCRPRTGRDHRSPTSSGPVSGSGSMTVWLNPCWAASMPGDPARLSAKSTVPEIKAMAEGHRSLYLTMRSRRAQAPNQQVRRWFPSQGHGVLVDALVKEISPQAVLAGTEVSGVERTGAGWCISTAGGRISAEELVLAVPAYAAADLLEPLAPELSSELRGIPYVDVANATLAFRAHDLPELPPGTGFLVPPVEDRFIVGCTWLTNKWPHLVNDDVVLIKSMVGRASDRRWLTMSDEQLIEAVRAICRACWESTRNPSRRSCSAGPRPYPSTSSAMRIGWRRSIARSPTSVACTSLEPRIAARAWPAARLRRPQLPTASREGEPHAVVHGRADRESLYVALTGAAGHEMGCFGLGESGWSVRCLPAGGGVGGGRGFCRNDC